MLDPWIIEEIRRREDEQRREREACRIELPLYEDRCDDTPKQEQSETDRGVTIIDL